MLQRIAQLGAGSAEPQRPDGARGRRRAGTSSTTSSAQQSPVGLSTSRPSAAHFLRPNKAWEGVFKPPAAGRGWGFPADLTSTLQPVATLPGRRRRPPMVLLEQATRLVPFTPRSGGDGDEMFGNPSGLPGKCVCV